MSGGTLETRSHRWPLAVVMLVVLIPEAVRAQIAGDPAGGYSRSAAYLEIGGLTAFEGGAFSLNYELRVLPRGYVRLGLYAGAKEISDGANRDSDLAILAPLMLNVLLTGERHHLEVGAGTRIDILPEGSEARAAAALGYRYQPRVKGIIVRAGLSFDLGQLPSGAGWTLYPWPSVSLGYSF